jgi:hypothetical protein
MCGRSKCTLGPRAVAAEVGLSEECIDSSEDDVVAPRMWTPMHNASPGCFTPAVYW